MIELFSSFMQYLCHYAWYFWKISSWKLCSVSLLAYFLSLYRCFSVFVSFSVSFSVCLPLNPLPRYFTAYGYKYQDDSCVLLFYLSSKSVAKLHELEAEALFSLSLSLFSTFVFDISHLTVNFLNQWCWSSASGTLVVFPMAVHLLHYYSLVVIQSKDGNIQL